MHENYVRLVNTVKKLYIFLKHFPKFVAVNTYLVITDMSLHFFLKSGEPLVLKPGFPENYTASIINGANASHVISAFGRIVLQEFKTRHMSMYYISVLWEKPKGIKCQYNYTYPVIFSCAMLKNSMSELIKGAGDVYLKTDQFTVLTGKKWSGLVISDKAGEHHFINFAWNADFLNRVITDDTFFKNAVQGFNYGLVSRLTTVPGGTNGIMSNIIEELMGLEYTINSRTHLFHELMIKYLKLMFSELKDCSSLRKKMTETDWYNVNKAKNIIEGNPRKRFTTREMSMMTGVNEQKLKKLFRIVTGHPLEEYRKYLLLVKAARNIIQYPDTSIKLYAVEAGYTSLSTFTRAFGRLGCTPGELREDTWDLSKVDYYFIPENENDGDE